MPVVQREAGIHDRLLRPLCARNLPETLPEREGWVDRSRLHGFSGRSRKPQIALAHSLELNDFAQPAGGCCFLTNEAYSSKLKDLWSHRGEKRYDFDDIMLLKVGRHLRPRSHFKLIVARDAGETQFLSGYRKRFRNLEMTSHSGPLTLIEGEIEGDDLELAARVAARFGQGRDAERVSFRYRGPDGNDRELSVRPLQADEVPAEWYV
jgi:tRNA U34 2-thiouridine synthase MnmA/TrmU